MRMVIPRCVCCYSCLQRLAVAAAPATAPPAGGPDTRCPRRGNGAARRFVCVHLGVMRVRQTRQGEKNEKKGIGACGVCGMIWPWRSRDIRYTPTPQLDSTPPSLPCLVPPPRAAAAAPAGFPCRLDCGSALFTPLAPSATRYTPIHTATPTFFSNKQYGHPHAHRYRHPHRGKPYYPRTHHGR